MASLVSPQGGPGLSDSRPKSPYAQIVDRLVAGTLPDYVVSHPGHSQYNGVGSGVSACGLAALNCARVVLGRELGGMRGPLLLKDIMRRETTEEVLQICLHWSSPAHLEVEDIYQSPYFHKSLRHESFDHGLPGLAQFREMLQLLRDKSVGAGRSSCTVVTRPPEIIACFYIADVGRDMFVIFDSHPRPHLHSSGAAFIFKNSLGSAASYLAKLLSFDQRLLRDNGLQWEAQLLGNFSSNIFVSKQTSPAPEQWQQNDALLASLEILAIRAECLELRSQKTTLSNENSRLRAEVARLRAETQSTNWYSVNNWRWGQSGSHAGASTSAQRRSQSPAIATARGATQTQMDKTESPLTAESVSDYSTAPQSRDELQENSDGLKNGKAKAAQPNTGFSDLEFAMMQQMLFDEENERLQVERNRLAQKDLGSFKCGVCFDEYSKEFVATVVPCNHHYCRDCVHQHVVAQVEERRFPILCPSCTVSDGVQEPTIFDSGLIQQIGLTEAQYSIFVDLELAAVSIMIHCRSCGRAPYVDKAEYTASKIMRCPLPDCGHAWCKQCSQEVIPDGREHSCDGSAELTHLMREHGWKYCPGCQTPAEKISGCNHMTCGSPGCHTHFCYVCGESIVQSINRQDIQAAVGQHYRQCRLLEDVPDRPVPPDGLQILRRR